MLKKRERRRKEQFLVVVAIINFSVFVFLHHFLFVFLFFVVKFEGELVQHRPNRKTLFFLIGERSSLTPSRTKDALDGIGRRPPDVPVDGRRRIVRLARMMSLKYPGRSDDGRHVVNIIPIALMLLLLMMVMVRLLMVLLLRLMMVVTVMVLIVPLVMIVTRIAHFTHFAIVYPRVVVSRIAPLKWRMMWLLLLLLLRMVMVLVVMVLRWQR